MAEQLSSLFFFSLPISNASPALCPKRNRAADEMLLFACSQPSKAPSPQPTQLEVSSGRALGERARAQPGQRLLSAPQPPLPFPGCLRELSGGGSRFSVCCSWSCAQGQVLLPPQLEPTWLQRGEDVVPASKRRCKQFVVSSSNVPETGAAPQSTQGLTWSPTASDNGCSAFYCFARNIPPSLGLGRDFSTFIKGFCSSELSFISWFLYGPCPGAFKQEKIILCNVCSLLLWQPLYSCSANCPTRLLERTACCTALHCQKGTGKEVWLPLSSQSRTPRLEAKSLSCAHPLQEAAARCCLYLVGRKANLM